MEKQLSHDRIAVIDCETTGLDKVHDRIIQISCELLDKDLKSIRTYNTYVLPQGQWHISAAASEVNGITDDFIKENGRPINIVAKEVVDFIGDADYLTYNGNQFDIEFIYRDFADVNVQFPIEGRRFYDAKLIETRLHSNRLIAVYERYVGKTMEDSDLNPHDSMSDVYATSEVFRRQLKNNKLTLDEVAEWSENQMFSPEGSIKNAAHTGQDELLVFKNGKYKDQDMFSVMQTDPGYLRWWSEKVATSYSRDKARKYLLNRKKQEGC